MKQKPYDYFSKEVTYYIISLLFCLIFLVWSMQLWSADLSVPFSYTGDAIFEGELIKGIIDNGWLYQNVFVGLPTGLVSYDYPVNAYLDFILMKLISYIFPNWALTMNVFFLLTFPLTTIFTLFVLRQFKISPLPAIVGSLLFTFIPFHFLRGESHLVLSSYFLVPLVILVIFWIFEGDFLLECMKKDLKISSIVSMFNKKTLFSLLVCIGIASAFVYYPFFSCFFIFITGVCATISNKKLIPLLNACLLIGIIVFFLFTFNLPSTQYQLHNGKNPEVAIRYPAESEVYGLKIVQLLLPVNDHRIPIFAQFSSKYAATSPLVNENSFATLGLIGSIGFIILILNLFYQLFTKSTLDDNEILKKIKYLSVLNLSAVLLATVGGIGTVIAYLFFPEIRAYNRISVFIAFFCITAIMMLLDVLLQKYSKNNIKKYAVVGCILIVLFFGIYDQTSDRFIPDYKNIKELFMSDEHFVNDIEKTYPDDTRVFQLPYVPFPENPAVYGMSDYDHFRAYLHSENISWSYGAMKGRDGDLWQREIVTKPLDVLLEDVSFSGFNGIYLDSYGYTDNGKEMISRLSSALQTTPIVSENKRLYFFDMTDYNNRLKFSSATEIDRYEHQFQNLLKLEWHDGFSGLEGNDSHNWRWSSSEGTLIITNPSDKERTFLINTTFSTGNSDFSQLKIDGTSISENLPVNNQGFHYQKKIDLPPGRSLIKFKSDAQRVNAPGDPRYLVFSLHNFKITEIERSSDLD
jgi:phosphoglycerol transferase